LCFVNLIVWRSEKKAKLIFLYDNKFKFPNETLVSYSRSTNVNVNISFPNSSFEENLVIMCLASYFDIIENWKLIDMATYIMRKKILNTFLCVEVRILVEKLNVYEGHISPRPFIQTCWLETTSLCLNTRLLVNKKFPNSHYFYWK
jgi:hypothetical protein